MSVDRERASSEYDAAVERLGRSAGAMYIDALKITYQHCTEL
jgi:hypothetical protein